MREIEKPAQDREPFLPRYLARPIGLMAYNWVMNQRWKNRGEGPKNLADPSLKRFIGAVALGGVEVVLPSTSRSFIRAMGERSNIIENNRDEDVIRFGGGIVFDAITIGGAIVAGTVASSTTYDVGYGWNIAIASKLALNTGAHLVIDKLKKIGLNFLIF